MAEKVTIPITGLPANASSVVIRYRTDAGARARVYLFDDDQNPRTIHGPSGDIRLNVSLGRYFVLERLTSNEWAFQSIKYSPAWDKIIAIEFSNFINFLSRSIFVAIACAVLVGFSISSLYWYYIKSPSQDSLKFMSSTAPLLAVVVSIIALILNLKHNRHSMGIGILANLNKEFESDELKRARAGAALALIHDDCIFDSNVNTLLDFFENIALLEKRGGGQLILN
ncbi:hypothetical protein FSO04_42825 [Paraburkholderia madseniana]|uniref:Uncharacterized protein n=1 Tax=Paraburkholderia madseniana TaxID=2599607 RepID=A0A6N6W232_9BURK|nr:hypothetical protein [Paraburkholderia madseniana]KAE8753854.1 hypothetical protein FSO04_42825 [Paraburkholderia madseniana]